MIRIQIECDGVVTSDVIDDYPSTWRAIGDTIRGVYAFRLIEFTMTNGWLQYAAPDGTIIRSRRV